MLGAAVIGGWHVYLRIVKIQGYRHVGWYLPRYLRCYIIIALFFLFFLLFEISCTQNYVSTSKKGARKKKKKKEKEKRSTTIFHQQLINKVYPTVNRAIYFSAHNSMPNTKALAHVRFEISCTQRYVSSFEKGATARPPEKKAGTGCSKPNDVVS